jgi:hypothetical protein
VHPAPSPARANFTLMTECMPERSGCYSVYSMVCTVPQSVRYHKLPPSREELHSQSTQSSNPLLSGVHSVMRVKLALAGQGGGCTPTPSHYIYHHQ